MKKIFLLTAQIFFCASPLWLLAQQPEKTEWAAGKTRSEGAYNSERSKTGGWKYYYQNGQMEAAGSYAGKRVDKSIEIVKKSKTSAIEDTYDVREGAWLFYHENGKMKAKVTYQMGCPTGLLERWHENGNKAEESEYLNCKAHGNRKMWDKDGKLYFENQLLEAGKSLEIEWFANGNKKSEVPYKDGQQFGKVRRWYPNGNKEEEVMMRDTRVHGLYRSWYENGNKKMEFFSINNIMSDEYREWSEQGKLVTEIVEMSDQKAITVKQYWDNGKLKMQGTSKLPANLSIHNWAQSKIGAWTYWLKDGSVLRTENYSSNGQLSTMESPD